MARPTMKAPSRDETIEQNPVGQSRPKDERFILRVDNQPKRSFSSKEPAATAAAAIKKAYPVVMVSVLDSQDGSVEVFN